MRIAAALLTVVLAFGSPPGARAQESDLVRPFGTRLGVVVPTSTSSNGFEVEDGPKWSLGLGLYRGSDSGAYTVRVLADVVLNYGTASQVIFDAGQDVVKDREHDTLLLLTGGLMMHPWTETVLGRPYVGLGGGLKWHLSVESAGSPRRAAVAHLSAGMERRIGSVALLLEAGDFLVLGERRIGRAGAANDVQLVLGLRL